MDLNAIEDDIDIENLTDITEDSNTNSDVDDTKSDSQLLENGPHFVLELRALEKNQKQMKQSDGKQKRVKKRKRSTTRNEELASSSSGSETSLPVKTMDNSREEFYDARESFDTLPEKQQSSLSAPAMSLVESIHQPEALEPAKVQGPAFNATPAQLQ